MENYYLEYVYKLLGRNDKKSDFMDRYYLKFR
jgi:hypothetical protein